MQEITSTTNTKVKAAKSLHQKKYRDQTGQFIFEGTKILNEAIKAKITISQIFSTNEELLNEYQNTDAEIFLTDDKVQKTLSTTNSTAELIAIAQIPKSINRSKPNKLSLYCENIQDPSNLGAIFRSTAASGVVDVYLSKDCCDIYNSKCIRSSAGNIFKLNIQTLELKNLVNNYLLIGTSLQAEANYKEYQLKTDKPKLLVIGNEGQGLSDQAKSLINDNIKIDLANGVESLNVVVATSIILFELTGDQS